MEERVGESDAPRLGVPDSDSGGATVAESSDALADADADVDTEAESDGGGAAVSLWERVTPGGTPLSEPLGVRAAERDGDPEGVRAEERDEVTDTDAVPVALGVGGLDLLELKLGVCVRAMLGDEVAVRLCVRLGLPP